MLGLKTGTVVLYPHETAWETDAAEIIRLLKAILGDVCIDAQHVGSTAVRGIAAKPIIDIAVAVRDIQDIMPFRETLAQHGIFYRKEEHGGQLLFFMGTDIRTHFIHIVQANSSAWRNYLHLRDYLNANPYQAAEYEAVKRRLQTQFPADRAAYTEGKAETIARLLQEAAVWRAAVKGNDSD